MQFTALREQDFDPGRQQFRSHCRWALFFLAMLSKQGFATDRITEWRHAVAERLPARILPASLSHPALGAAEQAVVRDAFLSDIIASIACECISNDTDKRQFAHGEHYGMLKFCQNAASLLQRSDAMQMR